jgi:hypothetical protein
MAAYRHGVSTPYASASMNCLRCDADGNVNDIDARLGTDNSRKSVSLLSAETSRPGYIENTLRGAAQRGE